MWLVASVAPAHADTERYAVVIGANRGASDEQPLRYAESDAQRFADLLGDGGGVPGENQVVLRGVSAAQVRHALIATNERIRMAPRPAADAVLLVYYSGHGDADALHLGDTALPLRELESLVRGSPATVRVLAIDACRSGSITRVKGGRPAPPLALATAAPLLGEGMIVLTASTPTEDAQESDPRSVARSSPTTCCRACAARPTTTGTASSQSPRHSTTPMISPSSLPAAPSRAPGFTRARQGHRQLDEVLIGEPVGAIVGDR